MSAVVLRRAFTRLAALRLRAEADRPIVTALRAATPGPGHALLSAGRDAGLQLADAVDRAAVAFCAFAAFNLSDDLSDGDCNYLAPDLAAAALLVIHGLFFAGLSDLEMPQPVRSTILAHLAAAEEAQLLEIGTERWDAGRLQIVTDGIAGCQWAAYLQLMWAGTTLEDRAATVARDLGRVALLAGDIADGDPRWTGLPPSDQRVVIGEALAAARALRGTGLSFASPTLDAAEPTLRARLTAPSTS